MNLEPQKLFIGLMDFFTVLLPGAVLCYLLAHELPPELLQDFGLTPLEGFEGLAIFAVASYFAGHLIYLIGSLVLDPVSEKVQRHTRYTLIQALAAGRHRRPRFGRPLARLIGSDEDLDREALVQDRVIALKDEMLKTLQVSGEIRAFQWAKIWLTAESPESMVQVQRFEADQKFFRSLVVVLVAVIIVWVIERQWHLTGIGALLLLAALWRFLEQRRKAIRQAYWAVLTLAANKGKGLPTKPAVASEDLTHAGGVVYRQSWSGLKFLVVTASKSKDQWVLPKGHIEAGEIPAQTAVREVHEESSVWGRVVAQLGITHWQSMDETEVTRFYLMQFRSRDWFVRKVGTDRARKSRWISASEISILLPESRDIVRQAEKWFERK